LPDVDMQELIDAFSQLLKRAQAFEHHHIQREVLSTRERMSAILDYLTEKQFVEFSELFDVSEGKSGVVVTFLALLELVKEKLIECVQNKVFGAIHLKLCVASNE
jgi:segregation and condensation protein A